MGQPQHGYTTRTARAEARPEDSGISSRQLQATRGCQVSRATRHEGTRDPDKQPHHHQKQRQSGGAAPVTGPCTRSGALHPFRRGALPTDRVQRPNKQEQTRNWHTEPLTATPLHAHLGPTGGGMGTPPTPPPALRPTPAHSDTSYTLKCEESLMPAYAQVPLVAPGCCHSADPMTENGPISSDCARWICTVAT